MSLQPIQEPEGFEAGLAGYSNPFEQGFLHGITTPTAGEILAAKQRQKDAQAQADAAAKTYQQALNAAILDPSVENYRRLMLLNPKEHEAIGKVMEGYTQDQRDAEVRDLSAIRGHLEVGNPIAAQNVLQRRIEADKKAGHDTSDDQAMLDLIRQNPKAAKGMVDYTLAGAMGVDKWGEAFGKIGDARRADAELPGKIANQKADTDLKAAQAEKATVEAELAPEAQRADIDAKRATAEYQRAQINVAAERLQLDRDTLESNVGLKLEELANKGTALTAGSEKLMSDKVVEAESSRALGARASSLADRLETSKASGGWFSTPFSVLTGITGDANTVTQMRREYEQLRNSQAVKNLPPGPASDKDIQLALKGFPPPSASKETLVSFLRGMSKLQDLAANSAQAQADWISENGNIGSAKKDITVNGVRVPAGTTFGEFSKSRAAYERRQSGVEDRSYMRFGR